MSDPAQYHVHRPENEKQYGPVDLETLQGWILRGAVVGDDLIYGGATEEWVSAADHEATAEIVRLKKIAHGEKQPATASTATSPIAPAAKTAAKPPPQHSEKTGVTMQTGLVSTAVTWKRVLPLVFCVLVLAIATANIMLRPPVPHSHQSSPSKPETVQTFVLNGSAFYVDYVGNTHKCAMAEVLVYESTRISYTIKDINIALNGKLEESYRCAQQIKKTQRDIAESLAIQELDIVKRRAAAPGFDVMAFMESSNKRMKERQARRDSIWKEKEVFPKVSHIERDEYEDYAKVMHEELARLLPTADYAASTDADGNFSITLKTSKTYYIYVSGKYGDIYALWAIALNDISKQQRLLLNNSNMLLANSSASPFKVNTQFSTPK